MAVLRIKNTKLKSSILILEVFLIIVASYFLYTIIAPKPQPQIICVGSPLCAENFIDTAPLVLLGTACNASGFFAKLGNNFQNITLQRIGTAILGESGANDTGNASVLFTGSLDTLGRIGIVIFKNYRCVSQNTGFHIYFEINYSTNNSGKTAYYTADASVRGAANSSGTAQPQIPVS